MILRLVEQAFVEEGALFVLLGGADEEIGNFLQPTGERDQERGRRKVEDRVHQRNTKAVDRQIRKAEAENRVKAKEADQLILDVPEDTKVLEGDVLTFEKGMARDGITVLGWPTFERRNARVKAKMETGKAEPTYFIYKNDRTELGRAKGDMLRYLWAYCPNNDPETYNTLSRIA